MAVRDQLDGFALQFFLFALDVGDGEFCRFEHACFFCGGQVCREERVFEFAHVAEDGFGLAQGVFKDADAGGEAVEDAGVDGVLVDEVPDEDAFGLLADAVNTADALFDAHRVPGEVVVDDKAAEL